MSTSTIPQDLADLRRDLLARVGDVSGVTSINNIADRYLNTALHDVHVHPGHIFPWNERRDYLLTHAPYSTGTVSITAAARTTVTGVSTLWNTAVAGMGFNNVRVGGKLVFEGSEEVYEVTAIASDTSLTINPRWTGDALSAATYSYFEDEYELASDFNRPIDVRSFSDAMNIPLIGPSDFRMRFPRNSTAGAVRVATLIQLSFSGNANPRYRVVFHQPPDAVEQIPYVYASTNLAVSSAGSEQAQLSATTDEPILPLRFRHILVYGAAFHWLRDKLDDTRSQEMKAEYTSIFNRMVGEISPNLDRPRFQPQHAFRTPSRLGRFDVNGRFDRGL